MIGNVLRERHTSAVLMYGQAMEFLESAKRLASNDTPALFLACHGLELALKSYLRAKGAPLTKLRAIRHSIIAALNDCVAQGLVTPRKMLGKF
jgi:HEPN domain-containing protein